MKNSNGLCIFICSIACWLIVNSLEAEMDSLIHLKVQWYK